MAHGIHDGTKLLLSSIELPDDPVLQYSIYTSNTPDALTQIECLRRKLSSSSAEPLFTSPITRVHFISATPLLYIFNVASQGDQPPAAMALDDLTPLLCSEIAIDRAVSERMLCAEDHGPCTCSSHSTASRPALGTLDESTKDVNLAQKLFLAAVRDRLVDEICVASLGKGHIPAVRLHNGFCLLPHRRSTEWTRKWDTGNKVGVIFCEMQLHLTATHILVQPHPHRLITLLPPADLAGGTAILLLPHGILAFYIQPHTADDTTLTEFTQSLSENGVSYTHTNTITKDFVRCYVPFRRVNDRQDGGITTIWPRALVLSTPSRAPLPSLSASTGVPTQASSTTATQRSQTGTSTPTPNTHSTIATSLTSLSLQSPASLSTLSTAMGAFVDAAMKERERPKTAVPVPTMLQRGQPQNVTTDVTAPQIAEAVESLPPAATQTSARPGLGNGAAQSYPSPLEMTVGRTESSASAAPVESITNGGEGPLRPAAEDPPNSAPILSMPETPNDDTPLPSAPAAYTSQNSLNNWDSMGFGGVGDGNFGFGGGDGMGGMAYDPFSAALTADDFSLFDVPAAVHDTSAQNGNDTNDSGNDVLSGGGQCATALPDVMLALSGQTQDFGSASLIDWNIPEPGAFTVVGEAGSLSTARGGDGSSNVLDASDFDLSTFQNDPQLLTLLGKGHNVPEITLEQDSSIQAIHLPQWDGPSPGADEDEEADVNATNAGFSAVRFGKDHNLLDEKYYNGKYSLPSPPPDNPTPKVVKPKTPKQEYVSVEAVKDDSTKYSKAVGLLSSPLRASTVREGDLRARYMAATNPSRAMLYKLAGTKRFWEVASLGGPVPGSNASGNGSIPVTESANAGEPSLESPSKKRRLTWSTANEAWRNPTPPAEESDDDDDGDGDSSMGGNDEWGNDDAFDVPMDGVELASPTGYFPSKMDVQRHENPTKLLQVRFDRLWIAEHELVAPSDITLPTAISSASSLLSPYRTYAPLVPMSVPTPVSPEAQPSTNDGPTRLASNVACRYAKEIGRNPLWNAVVVALREISPLGGRVKRELWQVEIDDVVDALKLTKNVVWGKSIAEIAESEDDRSVSSLNAPPSVATPAKTAPPALDHIQILQSPKIHLGHGNNVVVALPSITRFWDQLNVTPLNGPKDVHCVALISDTGSIRLDQAEGWLEKLGKIYAARRLGSHHPVQVEQNREGVAAIKWEKLRSICNTFVRAAKETQSKPLIVYVIVPNTFADLSHPAAVSALSAIAEVSGPRIATPGTVVFMLIPEVFLSHSRSLSQNADFGMERLALTVYDAFPRTVFRQHSRLSAKKNGADEIFDAFAFVLACRRPPKSVFVEKWPAPNSNTSDRYAFLHAAYNVSANGEWVVATLVTETGDDLESQVWRVDEHDALNSIVRNVLDFVLKHALRADIEWRITLSKSGTMSLMELNAWTSELASRVDNVEQSMHLTLLSLTSGDAPIFIDTPKLKQLPTASFIPPRSETPKDNTVFIDASSEAFLVFPHPVDMLPSVIDQITDADFLSSRKEEVQINSLATPIITCWLIHVFRRPEWTQRQDASSLSLAASSASVSSGHIHALHLVRFGNSTYSGEAEDHMRNIATNFYDLTILHEIRTGFTGVEKTSKQPLHVAVVNSMTAALDGLQL